MKRFLSLTLFVVLAACSSYSTTPIGEQHTAASVNRSGTGSWASFTYSGSAAAQMVIGSDGAVWSAMKAGNVSRFDPSTFAQTSFPLTGIASGTIASNPYDGNLYLPETVSGSTEIAQLSTSGSETDFPTGLSDSILAITACSDHNIWTLAHGPSGYYIGLLTVSTGVYRSTETGDYYALNGLVCGPDGNLWTTGMNGSGQQPFTLRWYVGGGGYEFDNGVYGPLIDNTYGKMWTIYAPRTFVSVTTQGVTHLDGVNPPTPTAAMASGGVYLWWVEKSRLHSFNTGNRGTSFVNIPYPATKQPAVPLYAGPSNTLWSTVYPTMYVYTMPKQLAQQRQSSL